MVDKSTMSPKTVKPEFDEETIERVTLVKHSLFSAYYQNRFPVVDLRQLINRLTMLLQERCVIVMLEKEENVGYRILFHTCLDPFWKDDFEEFIEKTLFKEVISKDHSSSENLIILDEKKSESFEFEIAEEEKKYRLDIKDYLIEFRDGMYFMIHEMYSPRDEDPAAKDNRRFLPIRIKDNKSLSYLSERLHYEKEALRDPIINKIFGDEELRKVILGKVKYWKNKKFVRTTLPVDLDIYSNLVTDEYFNYHFKKISNIFNQEYINIQKSHLLTSQNTIPNIIFFVREFAQKELRFKREQDSERYYPYRIRILIPEEQKKDLRNGFIKLKELKNNSDNIIEFGEYLSVKNVRDDSFFWELLNKEPTYEEKDGIDDILKIIEEPNKLYARSMSDASFDSGYVNIKEGPFTFRGESRLEKNELDLESESDGYRRSICIHYAFLVFSLRKNTSTISKNKQFQILTVPGSIGGSPFFCAGFVYPLIKKEEKEKQPEYQRKHHRMWLNNFHFYHTIYHYLIFNMRTKITRLYLDEVQSIFENEQDIILDNIVNNRPFNKKYICDLLNPKLHILCRTYPFSLITFSEKLDNQLTDNIFILDDYAGGDCPLAVHIHDNPFFLNQIASGRILRDIRIFECIKAANYVLKRRLIDKIQVKRLKES